VDDVDFSWNVVSDFEVGQVVNGNEIELLVEDEELVDEKFKLQVLVNENVIGEIIITIASIF
jgi:hypothetical protein